MMKLYTQNKKRKENKGHALNSHINPYNMMILVLIHISLKKHEKSNLKLLHQAIQINIKQHGWQYPSTIMQLIYIEMEYHEKIIACQVITPVTITCLYISWLLIHLHMLCHDNVQYYHSYIEIMNQNISVLQ